MQSSLWPCRLLLHRHERHPDAQRYKLGISHEAALVQNLFELACCGTALADA